MTANRDRPSIAKPGTDSPVELPARALAFWTAHSGISWETPAAESATAINTGTQVLNDSSSLTAAEVAEKLHLSVPTVRHHTRMRKLYSNPAYGRHMFPGWQFTKDAGQVLPGLERVLSTLPEDLHPLAVAGFFLTPQPDLVMNGEAVPVALWLERGGAIEPVLAIASALAAGL